MMTTIDFLLKIFAPLSMLALLVFLAISLLKLRFEVNAFVDNLIDGEAATPRYDDTDLRRMIDRRMTMLEARTRKLIEKQMLIESTGRAAPVTPLKNELPVEYAVRMARAGASVEDLVQSCGLNVGEAQLLLRLHASRRMQTKVLRH